MRVLTRPNLGGPTRQAIALWHAHRARSIETLLVTGVVGPDEAELSPSDHGVPQVTGARLSGGWLQLSELRRGVNLFADRGARRRLRQLIRAFRPDVVHTHTTKAGAVGRRAAFAERVPVVAHTFHGHVLSDYFAPLPSLLLRRLERRLARRTDLLFAVSDSCADELAARRVAPRERFLVTPPAVAAASAYSREEARRRLSLSADAWVVAAVGRLVPIKRPEVFVDLIAGHPDMQGDLLGDGPLRQELTARAGRGCRDRLRLRGAEPDAARLLPAYDALVMSSVREGCPLVAIEAFAAGVPVVGYDVPGVRDALSSVGRGLLVPVEDGVAGLAAAVRRLRDDPALRAAVIKDSAAAATTCDPAAVGDALAESYHRALSSRRSGAIMS